MGNQILLFFSYFVVVIASAILSLISSLLAHSPFIPDGSDNPVDAFPFILVVLPISILVWIISILAGLYLARRYIEGKYETVGRLLFCLLVPSLIVFASSWLTSVIFFAIF